MKPMKKLFLIFIFALSFPLFAKGRADEIPEMAAYADAKEIRNALKAQQDLVKVKCGSDKETFLMLALQNDRDDSIIKLLISYGSDVNAKNAGKKTPLMYACENESHLDVIERVIKRDAFFGFQKRKKILRKDINGKNSFDYAQRNSNSYQVIQLLEKYAVNPATEEVSQESTQPVQEEVTPEEEPLETLSTESLKDQASENLNETTPLSETTAVTTLPETAPAAASVAPAAEISAAAPTLAAAAVTAVAAEAITQETKEKSTSSETNTPPTEPAPNANSPTSVGVAAATFMPSGKLVKGTAQNNSKSIEEESFTQIAAASQSANTIHETNIEEKEDIPEPTPYKKEYLMDYAELDSDEIPLDDNFDSESLRHQFIENPDKRDREGRTLLMKSARDGNLELLEDLLFSQADVQLQDNDGWTALMFAARFQTNPQIIRKLLEKGVKPSTTNDYGLTALMLAAGFSTNSEVVKVLLENRSVAENEVITAFIYAVTSDAKPSILQLFLDKGIAINAPFQGKTPLMYACESNKDTETIQWLLDHGAKTHYKTTDGLTAFDFARENSRLPHNKVYWSLNSSNSGVNR